MAETDSIGKSEKCPIMFVLVMKVRQCNTNCMKATPELLQTQGSFFGSLADDIAQARQRVLLQTMSVDAGGLQILEEPLIRAREHGADVQLVYDRYSFFDTWTKEGRSGAEELKGSLGALAARGIQITPVGLVRPNPFAGRHHIKTYVADNTIYAGGGANLTGDTRRTADFMFRYSYLPDTAELLCNQLPEIAANRFVGERLPFTDDTLYLVDGGLSGKSPIYDTAAAMVQDADEAVIVSKMVPDGDLVRFAPAETAFYYNRPELVGRFNRLSLRYNALLGNTPPNSYGGDVQLHAKVCMVRDEMGHRALTGSHNFNMLGVRFGTQEAALLTTNEQTCELLGGFIDGLGKSADAKSVT